MARQLVGNPKFYIDMLSYWRARGNLVAIGEQGSNYPSQGGYMPYSIGLSPTDFMKIPLIDGELMPNIEAILKRDSSLNDIVTDKLFFGILGHNFNEFDTANPGLICYGTDGTEIFNLNDTSTTLTDICNFDQAESKPRFNGWSLTEISGVNIRSIKSIVFETPFTATDLPHSLYLGSFIFGHVYQMPHSPDLRLKMKREFDGIKEKQTKGGSSLTHINYTQAPDWVSLPAWELSTQKITDLEPTGVKETRAPARGRRSWELSWSYISSSDIFAVNELYGKGNPTDSDTNADAGYSAGTDFDSNGDFLLNSELDTSFISRLLDKTIGGALPFVFQPDGNNNSPDTFAICKLDQGSLDIDQVASSTYNVKMRIKEVW